VISPVAYQLELPHQWKVHNTFHASLFSPYKETEAHGPNYPGQIPDIVERQEEWDVEKILDLRRRSRNKQLQYLLKWKGYPEAENTWENKENVFAQELLEEFHQQYPKAIRSIRLQKDDSEVPHNDDHPTSLHLLLPSSPYTSAMPAFKEEAEELWKKERRWTDPAQAEEETRRRLWERKEGAGEEASPARNHTDTLQDLSVANRTASTTPSEQLPEEADTPHDSKERQEEKCTLCYQQHNNQRCSNPYFRCTRQRVSWKSLP